ncbi:MAG: DNA repair protein RadC [Myxococcota bacterium]
MARHVLRSNGMTITEHQAIAILLDGNDRNERASALQRWLGSSRRLLSLDVAGLLTSRLLTEVEAARLTAALALTEHCLRLPPDAPLDCAQAVIRLVGGLWRSATEQLWVVPVDVGLRPLGPRLVASGGVARCAVESADILRPAVLERAAGLFVLHNHPSGDPTPSLADLRFTRMCKRACRAVQLVFHDHLVVAGGRWASCQTGEVGAWAARVFAGTR